MRVRSQPGKSQQGQSARPVSPWRETSRPFARELDTVEQENGRTAGDGPEAVQLQARGDRNNSMPSVLPPPPPAGSWPGNPGGPTAFGTISNSPRLVSQGLQLHPVSGATVARDAAASPNRTGLPDGLKAGVESLSGISMDPVKVHYNSSRPEQLGALAYAQGSDIHLGPGQEEHLPHESWHVVQQAQGRVKPTVQKKVGVPVNDDEGLEREADAMGAKAWQMRGAAWGAGAPRPAVAPPLAGSTGPVAQLVTKASLGAVCAAARRKFEEMGFKELNAELPTAKEASKKDVQETWWVIFQELALKAQKDPADLSPVEMADLLVADKTLGLEAKKEKIKPSAFKTEETVFREPPKLVGKDKEELEGTVIPFTIEGLGEGRVALYKGLNRPSYERTLAWMSHGLQVSDGSKSVEKARSFGFVVKKNENLLRPEVSGGFDELIESFEKKKANEEFPRNQEAPDLLLGAHDPSIDFPKEVAREAIGSILPKCDVAILIDFVPFEDLSDSFTKSKEMKFLDFTYPPLSDVLSALPGLDGYDDFLMLCCRTDLQGKMSGGSGVIPESNEVVAFNPVVPEEEN